VNTVLIYVEHVGGVVEDASKELIAHSIGLCDQVEALVCAASQDQLNGIVGQLFGASTVIGICDERLASYTSETVLKCLNSLIATRNPDLVVMSYSSAGMDLAASAAIGTERNVISYVTELKSDANAVNAVSQIYGGKMFAKTEVDLPAVVVMVPGTIDYAAVIEEKEIPQLEVVDVELGEVVRMTVVGEISPETDDVDLTKAERILCVGRALGGTENLAQFEELATKLGAELAGSRPVIDAGWLSKARQVGKSGTKVKPRLYFMAGVSGAPEHLEGMQDSELIIALNSDEQAPIFSKAHYGAVCDMFQVVPALVEKLD
jgi:electron transfer flavoprotein alpha subunit